MHQELEVVISPDVRELFLGVVEARGLVIATASQAERDACADAVAEVRRNGMAGGETRREGVRRMLRAGGFKPAGRNKPAQEYLLRTALDSPELPAIWNAVDLLNMTSLRSGLPISLLVLDRVGSRAEIRYGKSGEKFVFNRAGQELEIEGLLCVCKASQHDAGSPDSSSSESIPLGSPIKDSMAGKIGEQDTDVAAFLYAPLAAVTSQELMDWCNTLGRGLVDYCGAKSFDVSTHRSA